jgi:hypothetical protein
MTVAILQRAWINDDAPRVIAPWRDLRLPLTAPRPTWR